MLSALDIIIIVGIVIISIVVFYINLNHQSSSTEYMNPIIDAQKKGHMILDKEEEEIWNLHQAGKYQLNDGQTNTFAKAVANKIEFPSDKLDQVNSVIKLCSRHGYPGGHTQNIVDSIECELDGVGRIVGIYPLPEVMPRVDERRRKRRELENL